MQPVMPSTTCLPRGFVLRQGTGSAAHALDGALAHCAGVDENDVGAGRIVGARVPGPLEQAEHHVGVGHVHLAAVGFDVNRGHGAVL